MFGYLFYLNWGNFLATTSFNCLSRSLIITQLIISFMQLTLSIGLLFVFQTCWKFVHGQWLFSLDVLNVLVFSHFIHHGNLIYLIISVVNAVWCIIYWLADSFTEFLFVLLYIYGLSGFFCFKVLSFSFKLVLISITLVTFLFMSWIYLIIFQARKKFLICLFKSSFWSFNLFISFILSHNLCFQVLRSCRHVGLGQWNTCPFFHFFVVSFLHIQGCICSLVCFFPLFSCAWFVCFVLLSPLGNLSLFEFIFRDNANFRNNFNGFRQC